MMVGLSPADPRSGISLLIHVGYYKAGSSWLQTQVFDNQNLGFFRSHTMQEIVRDFVLTDPFSFDPAPIRENLLRRASTKPELIPVLSHERLAGSPSSGGVDSKLIAEKLATTFPGAKVLLVVRRQQDAILSGYKQYIRSGGTSTLSTWLNPSPKFLGEMPTFSPAFYRYNLLIQYYQELFGRISVLVVPFELLAEDQAQFLGRILAFCGLAENGAVDESAINVSPGAASLVLRRVLNRVMGRGSTNLGSMVYFPGANRLIDVLARLVDGAIPGPVDRAVDKRWARIVEALISGQFDESNTELEFGSGLDLRRFGYDVRS